MPIHVISQPGSNFAIRLDGNDRTLGVLGIIQCTSTRGRPMPPQPFNGFNTANTPFGNGHVFALSLGGTDEPRNIVPQWEQWQETGAWRQIERLCEQYNGRLFRCDVTYDDTAVDDYATSQSDFIANRLSPWAHPGLPTGLRVRVYARGTVDPGHLVGDGGYDALLIGLGQVHPLHDSGVLDHASMPAEDVRYWQDWIIAAQAHEAHEAFESVESSRVTTATAVFESAISFTDFVLHPDTRSELQNRLRSLSGFSPTDISGLQVDRVLRATHELTSRAEKSVKRLFKDVFGSGPGREKREAATTTRQKSARESRVAKRRNR